MALRKPLNVALLAAFALAFLAPRCPAEEAGFSEIWAYLMAGEEQYLDPSFPITDVCYFCAGISSEGKLGGVPDRARIAAFPGRVHLVVAEVGNYALTNFCLDPEYPLRDRLVMDIVRAAGPTTESRSISRRSTRPTPTGSSISSVSSSNASAASS